MSVSTRPKNEYHELDIPCDACIVKIFPLTKIKNDVFMTNAQFEEKYKAEQEDRGDIDDFIRYEEMNRDNKPLRKNDQYWSLRSLQTQNDSDWDEEEEGNEEEEEGNEEGEEEEEGNEEEQEAVDDAHNRVHISVKMEKESEEDSEDDSVDNEPSDCQPPPKKKMKSSAVKDDPDADETDVPESAVKENLNTDEMSKVYLNGSFAKVKYRRLLLKTKSYRVFEKRLMAKNDDQLKVPHTQCHHNNDQCKVGRIMRACRTCRKKTFWLPKEICMNLSLLEEKLHHVCIPMYTAAYIKDCSMEENGWRLLFKTHKRLLNLEQVIRYATLQKGKDSYEVCKKMYPSKDIARLCLTAITKLHDKNIVHNNIKPNNIMVLRDNVEDERDPELPQIPKVRVFLIDFDNADWVEKRAQHISNLNIRFKSPRVATAMYYKIKEAEKPFTMDRYSTGLVSMCMMGEHKLRHIPNAGFSDLDKHYGAQIDTGLGAIYAVLREGHGGNLSKHCGDQSCIYCECFFDFMQARDNRHGWFTFGDLEEDTE